MGTLSSELGPHIERLIEQPRVYADANIPNGTVAYMRATLGWDVLFVLEHDDLRFLVRSPLTGIGHSQMVLRLGYGDEVPATPRRPPVIIER